MKLRVNIFNTSSNLPLYAAQAKGFFAERGLELEILKTPNSDELRGGLAAGRFEIAHAAVDNAVAMADGGADVAIVSGGDAGMNEFIVRPEIASLADMRGKVLAVDAPNTAYALAAKKILQLGGLLEGRDYTVRPAGGTNQRVAAMLADTTLAAAMVNPPLSLTVREKGLHSLGTHYDLLGPYQATGAFVMRPWARSNADALVSYLAAYIEGQRYAMDPAHKQEMVDLLVANFQLTPAVAATTYDVIIVPGPGLAVDARFNSQGFANVLAIRAEMEGGPAVTPERMASYVDLSYYERALAASDA